MAENRAAADEKTESRIGGDSSANGAATLGQEPVPQASAEGPDGAENGAKKQEPQEVSVHAESNGQSIGEIKLRVELRKRALPQ